MERNTLRERGDRGRWRGRAREGWKERRMGQGTARRKQEGLSGGAGWMNCLFNTLSIDQIHKV